MLVHFSYLPLICSLVNIHFKTIIEPCEAELREKASKFIGYAFPIQTEEEAQNHINVLWNAHIKACHVCYAYRLGLSGQVFRINDDGEPSGTAGKPIYGQLLSKELTDVLLCVVRYFGGTKLGASGLISAYKDVSKLCLDQAQIIEKSLNQTFSIKTNYEQMGQVLNKVKDLGINILSKEFNEDVLLTIGIPLDNADLKIRQLKAALLNFELERITEETEIADCIITKISIIKV
jgi:uncharacterized YigZ family protein